MKKNLNNIGWGNMILDSLYSSLFITILVIAFEVAFYLVVINNEIEQSTRGFINNLDPIYIDVLGQIKENPLYKLASPDQQKIMYETIKETISNTIKNTVDSVSSNISSRRKTIMITLFSIYGALILITIITGILLRKKIAWLQMLLFSIVTLIMIGGAEAYLYFKVYSQLHTVNSASMENKINEAIKTSLS